MTASRHAMHHCSLSTPSKLCLSVCYGLWLCNIFYDREIILYEIAQHRLVVTAGCRLLANELSCDFC